VPVTLPGVQPTPAMLAANGRELLRAARDLLAGLARCARPE
jgi:transcription-repair coupling factor (superfamily II helicase)